MSSCVCNKTGRWWPAFPLIPLFILPSDEHLIDEGEYRSANR